MSVQGHFSLLRWRVDATRDEARNVAVVLVDRDGHFGGIRAAPISAISTRLHDQGVLDGIVTGIEAQFNQERKPSLGVLSEWRSSMHDSLYFTEPRPTAVPDPDMVLNALFLAYVRPQYGGGNALSKGRILDKVVRRIRSRGLDVARGAYIGDFLVDAVVSRGDSTEAVEVLSFASSARKLTPVEHDAGFFLHAVRETEVDGLAVVQPPVSPNAQSAIDSYDRVRRWFDKALIPLIPLDQMDEHLAGARRLPIIR